VPETSIIIPFHDRLDWTRQAIASVIGQTYQDFEIIVIDDGSTVDYRASIENLDTRIRCIRQEQRGVSAARNAGIKIAAGEFIAFLDSDDLFLPEKLEIQIGILHDHPEVLLVHSSYIRMDMTGSELELVPSGTFTGRVYPDIYFRCQIATPTVVVRRRVFEYLKFEESARVGEDVILWTKISKLAEIIGVELPLAKVRIHGNNAILIPEKGIEGIRNILEFGLRADRDVKFILRQQIESHYYLNLAYWQVKKKTYLSAVSSLIISFLKWPFQKELYVRLFAILLPKSVRKRFESFMLD
jgi:glycosyltransferase involved in cell wall biosynthesis